MLKQRNGLTFERLVDLASKHFNVTEQTQIAEELGYTREQLNNWKRRIVPPKQYESIAEKLGITVDVLLDRQRHAKEDNDSEPRLNSKVAGLWIHENWERISYSAKITLCVVVAAELGVEIDRGAELLGAPHGQERRMISIRNLSNNRPPRGTGSKKKRSHRKLLS